MTATATTTTTTTLIENGEAHVEHVQCNDAVRNDSTPGTDMFQQVHTERERATERTRLNEMEKEREFEAGGNAIISISIGKIMRLLLL